MKGNIKGFVKGDVVLGESSRYVTVSNNNKKYVVADNGERRELLNKNSKTIWNPPLNKPALKGGLTLSEIKNKVTL